MSEEKHSDRFFIGTVVFLVGVAIAWIGWEVWEYSQYNSLVGTIIDGVVTAFEAVLVLIGVGAVVLVGGYVVGFIILESREAARGWLDRE